MTATMLLLTLKPSMLLIPLSQPSMFHQTLLENVQLILMDPLPLDSLPLLMFAIPLLSQPILMQAALLDASLSEVSQEHGLLLMTVETLSLEFKPSPSKIPLIQVPLLIQSVFSHQMDNTIASIPLTQTSSTTLMLALL